MGMAGCTGNTVQVPITVIGGGKRLLLERLAWGSGRTRTRRHLGTGVRKRGVVGAALPVQKLWGQRLREWSVDQPALLSITETKTVRFFMGLPVSIIIARIAW